MKEKKSKKNTENTNKELKNKILKIGMIILTIISLVTLSIFSYYLFKVNVVPIKYLLIGYGVLLIILASTFFVMYLRKNRILKIIGMIILALGSSAFIYLTGYLNNTYNFLNGMQIGEYDTINLSVIVLKDSNYNQISDLKDKKISYLDDAYAPHINKALNKVISFEESAVSDFSELPNNLSAKIIDAIILEDSYLNLVKEENEHFDEEMKVIYTFSLQVKSHTEDNKNINILETPFVLYISGIDQYGNVKTVRGRSDVNQIAIVNPKTNRILLVNTPRDYYVQLHGTTGLKDKLTHAGIYGIEKSITTLEDLYDIDINYYLRVNFDSLIKVVDAIGGIDINSDKAFRPKANKNIYINQGWNHLDGAGALAYARERKAYASGDNHRGANQQQVITAIIDKVSSSAVLISKYNNILKSLDGTFQTDMSMERVQTFIKYQIDKMPSWKVESIAVTGTGSKNYTYSMGKNWLLYVMEPDMKSVNNAKAKINEVLNEN